MPACCGRRVKFHQKACSYNILLQGHASTLGGIAFLVASRHSVHKILMHRPKVHKPCKQDRKCVVQFFVRISHEHNPRLLTERLALMVVHSGRSIRRHRLMVVLNSQLNFCKRKCNQLPQLLKFAPSLATEAKSMDRVVQALAAPCLDCSVRSVSMC